MEKKALSNITAGGIIGGIMIIYSLILNFMDLTSVNALNYASYAIVVIGVIVAVTMYGKSIDHTATFGKLFTFGFKTTAVLTLIVILFQIIFFLVFPEYKEKFFEIARENMIKQGNVSDEQIEMALEMTRKMFWTFVIGGSLFGLMFFGTIGSLIGAGVTKKAPKSPFEQPLQ